MQILLTPLRPKYEAVQAIFSEGPLTKTAMVTCSRSSARRRGASRARPPRRRRRRARRPPGVLPSPAQGRAEPRLSRMSSNLRQDALNNCQKFQKCHRNFARCGITEKSANSEIRSVQQLESEMEKPRAVQTCAIVDTKNAAQEVFRCI